MACAIAIGDDSLGVMPIGWAAQDRCHGGIAEQAQQRVHNQPGIPAIASIAVQQTDASFCTIQG
jgi:hypothetical protein